MDGGLRRRVAGAHPMPVASSKREMLLTQWGEKSTTLPQPAGSVLTPNHALNHPGRQTLVMLCRYLGRSHARRNPQSDAASVSLTRGSLPEGRFPPTNRSGSGPDPRYGMRGASVCVGRGCPKPPPSKGWALADAMTTPKLSAAVVVSSRYCG